MGGGGAVSVIDQPAFSVFCHFAPPVFLC